MRRAADILDSEVDQVAELMTTEMGKTLAAARQEVAKCATACRYFADHAEGFLADEPADAAAVGADRGLRPVPAARPGAGRHALELPLLAGHPLCRARAHGRQRRPAQARLQRAPDGARHRRPVRRAGFPRGAFQTLLIGSSQVEAVLRDDRVAAVTLTGSGTGRPAVAAVAGGR